MMQLQGGAVLQLLLHRALQRKLDGRYVRGSEQFAMSVRSNGLIAVDRTDEVTRYCVSMPPSLN